MEVTLIPVYREGKTFVSLTFVNESDTAKFLAKDRIGVKPLKSNCFLFRGADVPYLGFMAKLSSEYKEDELVILQPGEKFEHYLCLDDYYDLNNMHSVEVRYVATHPTPGEGIYLWRSPWVRLKSQ